jgi:hypothetical protein
MKEGLTRETEPIDQRPADLLSKLAWKVPEDQLTYSKLDRWVKKTANQVYRFNYRLLQR